MSLPLEQIAIVLALAVVVNRLVEAFVKPIFNKFGLDCFWLMYIAWVFGAALVYSTGINVFAAYIPLPWIGQLLTALATGGGANLLNDFAGKFGPTTINYTGQPPISSRPVGKFDL